MTPALTRELAALAVTSRHSSLPSVVQAEAARAFLNWVGCTLGGCREPAVLAALRADAALGGSGPATVLGHARRSDLTGAAFLNCLSSAILAFDDTHLATVTHPSGPVAAALLAYAEAHPVSGEEFANALVLGIEIQCRLSNLLLLPPARANLGWYITGLSGPVGAAAAVGRVMGLDVEHMTWALGLAASQASGFRSTHGSMAGAVIPAHAARCGLSAALLAAEGFTCTATTLEGNAGYVEVFGPGADVSQALAGFGEHFEMMANAYKPYPCGIVIHAAVDACLDLAAQLQGRAVERVTLRLPPLSLKLADRPQPRDVFEAIVSLQHWAAATLIHGRAGVAEGGPECVAAPEVVALCARVQLLADESLARDAAEAEVLLADGTVLHAQVAHARGSSARPLTDDELDAKFAAQARRRLDEADIAQLRALCWNLATLPDVGRCLTPLWQQASTPAPSSSPTSPR